MPNKRIDLCTLEGLQVAMAYAIETGYKHGQSSYMPQLTGRDILREIERFEGTVWFRQGHIRALKLAYSNAYWTALMNKEQL